MQFSKHALAAVLAALATAGATPAFAHSEDAHEKKAGPVVKEQKDWGIAGDARNAKRTVEVRMLDSMRFSPEKLEIKQGETVRFVVKNAGAVMHEFVIGTKKENDAHAEMMMKHPGMEHDEPYMAHVAPGKTGEIVWTFNRPGNFDFACLIAGHYQAGMVGKIKVAGTSNAASQAPAQKQAAHKH
ncbi:MAG: cupredoxin family protein [Methylibium sp.]|uniref:cupredoxin domain-containing protein n=1 Tax=Methylibium sp. TaxID=2067992 RepID=UPI001859E279|nr:cupredoxin family protein [Methylibium sp.]MBA3598240.1 cupredoxin family protein [Methylibium sp.]